MHVFETDTIIIYKSVNFYRYILQTGITNYYAGMHNTAF